MFTLRNSYRVNNLIVRDRYIGVKISAAPSPAAGGLVTLIRRSLLSAPRKVTEFVPGRRLASHLEIASCRVDLVNTHNVDAPSLSLVPTLTSIAASPHTVIFIGDWNTTTSPTRQPHPPAQTFLRSLSEFTIDSPTFFREDYESAIDVIYVNRAPRIFAD